MDLDYIRQQTIFNIHLHIFISEFLQMMHFKRSQQWGFEPTIHWICLYLPLNHKFLLLKCALRWWFFNLIKCSEPKSLINGVGSLDQKLIDRNKLFLGPKSSVQNYSVLWWKISLTNDKKAKCPKIIWAGTKTGLGPRRVRGWAQSPARLGYGDGVRLG